MSPQPPDLFPQRPVRSDMARAQFKRPKFLRPPSYKVRRILTLVVLTVIAGFGIRVAFGSFLHMTPGSVATIKAEGAWKQRPEQPGGLDIPNQNVQVYQALDNKDETKPIAEHLMPPPEAPLPVPSIAAPGTAALAPAAPFHPDIPQVESLTPPKLDINNISATPVTSATPETTSTAAISPAPVIAPPAPVSVPPPVSSVVVTSGATADAAAPVPVAAKPPLQPKVQPAVAQDLKGTESHPKSDRIVQLASLPDEATARAMAEKMQIRYSSILGTARLHLVKADVVGKGTFYRIQSQPITGDHAGGICAALKQMKAGCILVRP